MAHLTSPATRAALIQFGIGMMQPRHGGQTLVGQVGTSIGDAGNAAARVSEFQRLTTRDANTQANAAAELGQGQQRIGLEGERVGLEKEAGGRAAKMQSDALVQQEKENVFKERELDIKAESTKALEGYYGALGAAAANKPAKLPPGYKDEIDMAKKASMLDDDPMASFMLKKVEIDKKYGMGGQAAPAQSPAAAAPGAAAAAPPQEAVDMLKAAPSPQNKEFFDQTFGAGAAAKVLGQ